MIMAYSYMTKVNSYRTMAYLYRLHDSYNIQNCFYLLKFYKFQDVLYSYQVHFYNSINEPNDDNQPFA